MADDLDTTGAVASFLNADIPERARANVAAAANTKPDFEATIRQQAEAAGVPLSTARAMPEDTNRRAVMNTMDFDDMAQRLPSTMKFLAEQDNARIAHDDVQNMGLIETGLSSVAQAVKYAVSAPGKRTLAGDVGTTAREIAAGLPSAAAGVYGVGEVAAGLLGSLSGTIVADNPVRREITKVQDFLGQMRRGQTQLAETVAGPLPEDAGTLRRGVRSGLQSVGQQAPGLLLSVVTGNPVFGLGAAGVTTGGQSAGKALDQGKSPLRAALYGGADAAVEVGTEMLPMAKLLGDLKAGSGLLKTITTQALHEVPGEQVATALQDLNEWATLNPDKPFSDYVKGRPAAAMETLVATLVGVGVQTGAAHGAAKAAGMADQGQAGAQGAQQLQAIMQTAAASKLRERDPQAFADFVQKTAEASGAPPEVHIDVNALAEALQQSGITPEQAFAALPSLEKQYSDALAMGGDVVLPVGEFTAGIAGSPIEQALSQHVRTSADALSPAEAKEVSGARGEAMRQAAEDVLAEKEQANESTAVRAQVLEQLNTVGRFSPAVNAAYVDSVMALYETQAQRLGMSVAEFAKQYPLNVRATDTSDAPRKFNQGDTSPTLAQVLDRTGAPMALSISKQTFGANVMQPNAVLVELRDPATGERRGFIDFSIREDGVLTSENTKVAPALRGRGLAEAMYKAAREAGYDIAPGKVQTDAGHAMVGKLQAKGLINKEAAGQRFRAGDLDLVPLEGGRLNQDNADAKGTFTPSTNTIALLAKADLSTFHHELAHFYLEVLADMAAQPNAPATVVEDMNRVLEWFGVPDLDTWRNMSLDQQREFHEKFARGYEAYLFEGKAPSTALARTFQRFSEWMRRIYRSIKALGVEINPDIRRVYDRMLASDDAIKEAEQARAYAPLFKDEKALEEAGVDPVAYHTLNAEATADAVDQLQARSMRDMRWLGNAKSRALKALQKEAAEKRKVVEAQVREEVGAVPVYAAENFLRRGVLPEGDRNNAQRRAIDATQGMNTKLDLATLKDMYGDAPAAPWRYLATGKHGLATTKDGLHPDIVADIFGFPSGDALVRELLAAEPQTQVVEGLTDQRMLEEHGELASPDALERVAEQAIHNEARGKFIATELAALNKALGSVRVLVAAAKQYAEAVIGRKTLADIKPQVFEAAETRAAKLAEKSLGKSTEEAATAKRNQLLNHYAAKYAHDALHDIGRIREFFARVANSPDDKLKTRDMDVVNAARAVLAAYGVGRKGEAAVDYLKRVAAYDPDMSKVLQASVDAALQNAKPLAELTLDELRALNDEVASLWHLAKRSRQMEVDGDLLDREEVQDELKARLVEIGIPDTIPGEGSAVTPGQQRLNLLRSFIAAARRVESWVGALDGKDMGPFRRFVWQTIKEPADAYRTDKAKYLKQFRDLLAPIAPTLKKRLIDAPELGYTFGKDEGGVALSELLHAIAHTGNESNKRKLLLGRKWATENVDGTIDTSRWDAFIQRMAAEGVLTKAHFDFVQGLWDMLEAMKPMAQKTHRDVFGKYFAEITAEPVDTPFGQYAGGYMPAIADPRVVSDAKTRALMEEENASMAFAFPATNRGFTKGRVDYNKPLLLDLRTVAQHLDKVLLFSHMERPIRDVRRVLTSKGVAYGLNRIDPEAFDGILTPWLNRASRQQVETPVAGAQGLMRFFAAARARAGMAAMFGNVANAAQQVTGLSIAAVKVKPKHLLGAAADYLAHPRKVAQAVAEASPYMEGRMGNEIAQMNDAIKDVLLDPTTLQTAQAWMSKHAYFMQAAVDNVVGPIVWLGARNQALEQGVSDRDAIRLADAAVRETQGSTLPEDISRIETGNAFVRMFTQFAGYFNMQANLLGTEFAKVSQDMGLRKGAGRGLYILTLGFLVPAWVSELIVQAFRGGPGDDDKDGEYLDDWLVAVFGMSTIRGATAMIPGVGQVLNTFVNTLNKKPYDDRMSTAPAISMIESAVKAPVSVYKAATGEGKTATAVRDVSTAISMTVGLPVNLAAKPLAYAAEVNDGHVNPTGPIDAVRGAVTGTASPGSK
jgi:hypothetical protein